MKISNDGEIGTTLALEPTFRSRPLSKAELRKDFHRKTFERVEKSASMAMTYPRLKALKMSLLYSDREIVSRRNAILFRANVETAKSMLHFACPSSLCKDGGFDLSEVLRTTVAGLRKSNEGVMHCGGSRDEEAGSTTPCKSILQFKMDVVLKPKLLAVAT